MTFDTSRPWYVSDRVCDEYRDTLSEDKDRGGNLRMLKAVKILRSIIVNLGIILISFYSLRLGADPTIVGIMFLAVIGGYNGLELSDYLALIRAYKEVQQQSDQNQND